MSRYPEPKARGYHQAAKLNAAGIASSDALRLRALSSGQQRHMMAFAAGISLGHYNKWMSQSCHLAMENQGNLTRWLDKQMKP